MIGSKARNPWYARTFYLWLGMLALFSIGRAFYLFDYRLLLSAEPYSAIDLVKVFTSSLRFDSSVAAYLLLPLVIAAMAGGSRWLFLTYGSLVLTLSWITVMVDHYFYLYFKDHFNVFFWEFFENPSNAGLVISGLNDVVPLATALPLMAVGIGAGIWFVRRVAGAKPLKWHVPIWAWLLLFALAARGTADARPLSLQDRRIVLSRNSLINLLHTNPFLPLYRGYKDSQNVDALASSFEFHEDRVKRDFARVVTEIPGAKAEISPKGFHYLTQHLEPLGPTYLQRKPKHVVLVFMESFAAWLTDYDEDGFNQEMASGLLALKKQGLYFSRHFSAAGGTIKNIAAANLSFPVARDFLPSIVYHKEGYKPFPGRLPVIMSQLGYTPRFFYGGVIAWHRLYQFMPAMGYASVFAEHSFPDLPHHENGLYDDGTFSAVLDNLAQATKPTFTFIMTLSNHPPFDVPKGEEEPPIKVPASLQAKVLESQTSFMRRLVAYRYADRALKRFIEQLAAKGLAKDTLVVVTGDHAFSSGIGFGADEGWRMERVPLLFYGPDLLKPEFVGQSRDSFTTHLDLMPSLAALTTDKPLDVQTFGKSVFAGGPTDSGINHYFSCKHSVCLKDGQLETLGADTKFYPATMPDAAARKRDIQADEAAYYDAAMQYLFQFQP